MDPKTEIDFVKTITLAIEANLYHKYNRSVGKTSEYTSRSRFIVLNLKHERNFDLRFKILTEEITPSELADMNEDDLAPKAVHNERLAKQQEFFNAKMVKQEDMQILVKSRKGDMDIDEMQRLEDSYVTPVALEVGNNDNKAKTDLVMNMSRMSIEKSVNGGMNESINEDNLGSNEDRAVYKDIDDEMQGLGWGKFKEKVIERYDKYLPKEVADELQAALC